jgi:hypothetical protein
VHELSNELIFFIVLTVLLFMGLGVAMIVIMDHKARLPGDFVSHPFAIAGVRHDHPVLSFLTTVILLAIIACLLFELVVTLIERTGVFAEEKKPQLLQKLHEQRFTEKMRHFHNVPKEDLIDLGKKQACFYCHGDYPHSKRRMVRTLLNMHTQFIGCMTCHTDAEKIPEDSYEFRWLNYSGIEVTGRPYGTDLEPDSGFLVATDDFYSKIVVSAGEGEQHRLLELTEDNPEVQEFALLASQEKLSDEDREGIKRRFHTLIRTKGRFCSRCHTQESESYLPLRALGFSEQRIVDLTNLNLVGIVEKYREFYLPELMKQSDQQPGASSPGGETEQFTPSPAETVEQVPTAPPH